MRPTFYPVFLVFLRHNMPPDFDISTLIVRFFGPYSLSLSLSLTHTQSTQLYSPVCLIAKMSGKAASDDGLSRADDSPGSATESLDNAEKLSDAGSSTQSNGDKHSSDDDHQIDQDSSPAIE